MKITPLDIYNKEFRKKFSLRAYDGREVDEFLDHVAGAYEQSLKDLNQLKDENTRLKAEMTKYQQMERTLQETLIVAQETVKERKEQAEREARMLVENAKKEAQRVLLEAQDGLKDRMRQIQQLKEYDEFFRIRMKSLLDSHLQLLEKNETAAPDIFEELCLEAAATSEEVDCVGDDLADSFEDDLDDLDLEADFSEEDFADEELSLDAAEEEDLDSYAGAGESAEGSALEASFTDEADFAANDDTAVDVQAEVAGSVEEKSAPIENPDAVARRLLWGNPAEND